MPTESACYGCCLQPSYFFVPPPWNPQYYECPPVFVEKPGLTVAELDLLKKLFDSYTAYCSLDARSETDNKEFIDALHRLQQLVALRVARRVDVEVWAQPE